MTLSNISRAFVFRWDFDRIVAGKPAWLAAPKFFTEIPAVRCFSQNVDNVSCEIKFIFSLSRYGVPNEKFDSIQILVFRGLTII